MLYQLSYIPKSFGGRSMLAKQVLYQLSYTPGGVPGRR